MKTALLLFTFLGQMIEPITKHIRTSERTVIIKEVKCKNFAHSDQIQITYHDGDKYLGTFPIGKQHKLRNVEKCTEEIKVRATDDSGNVAETTFKIDQNIPVMSYRSVCRTPTSVVVKGICLENFPNKEDVMITYVCDGHDEIALDWKQGIIKGSSIEQELTGYNHTWNGGTIVATAIDLNNEYKAACQICVDGTGK